MSSATVKTDGGEGGSSGRRVVTQVNALEALVGAHPDALRAIFRNGRPSDPAELGDAPRGALLSFSERNELFLVTRPLLRFLDRGVLPWKGKTFDHGGNSGQNLVFGKPLLRFHAEIGPSAIDGKHALILRYDTPAHNNPWPIGSMVEELRTIGPGVAIGPALISMGGGAAVLFWFGLEAAH